LEKYFAPEFSKEDLINLPNYNFYIKLMINGVLSKSFSAMNIPPSSLPENSFIQEIIQHSREHYAALRQEIEKKIVDERQKDYGNYQENFIMLAEMFTIILAGNFKNTN